MSVHIRDFKRSFFSIYRVSLCFVLLLCSLELTCWATEGSGISKGVHGHYTLKKSSRRVRVFLDSGHGGKDLGAQGLNGVSEKLVASQLSFLVRESLSELCTKEAILCDILLSREKDLYISLADRVRLANGWGADLFVSLHANASPLSRVSGFEVYFMSTEASDEDATKLAALENSDPLSTFPLKTNVLSMLYDAQQSQHISESSRFAERLFGSMAKVAHPNGRGVRQGPFTVLAGTLMPAVLVEMGYVTNPADAKRLKNLAYLKRIASAISAGVVEYAKQRAVHLGQFSLRENSGPKIEVSHAGRFASP